MADVKKLEKITKTCMSDSDIKLYFPNAKIISYNELQKYDNIYELLPRPGSYAFILYQQSENCGHWVLLYMAKKYIEYFDSYGKKIDEPLNWLSKRENADLDIRMPYLSKLLLSSGKDIIYNAYCFQGKSKGISTCGRHCVLRLKMALDGVHLKDYIKLLEKTQKKTGRDYDEIVSALVKA